MRVRPCSERDMRSSLGRVTSMLPSSALATSMGAATAWVSVPLGPFTVTVAPSMSTVTPDGTEMGMTSDARHCSALLSRYQT